MSSFVATIDLSLAEKMKIDLPSQGFAMSTPPHTVFAAKKPGITCVLYTSGKLVIQGKNSKEFLEFYIEPEILGSISFSHPEIHLDFTPRIGVDEAGKGDFFGPLCIAGIYADQEGIQKLFDMKVRDSKTLSDRSILALATKIRSICPHSIVCLFPHKYNELYQKFGNLNHLLAWGHATAIEELMTNTGCSNVIIDQFASEQVVEKALARKHLSPSLTQRHRGEEDLVVAAASILARATFVTGLEKLGKPYQSILGPQGLPKGASAFVIEMARKLVKANGTEILSLLTKTHFKTTEQVCSLD